MKVMFKSVLVSVLIVCVNVVTAEAQTTTSSPTTFPSDILGLVEMGWKYKAKGAAGEADMKALSSFISQKYSTDKSAGTVKCMEWVSLVRVAGDRLDKETQAAIGQDMIASLVASKGDIPGVGPDGLLDICDCLKILAPSDKEATKAAITAIGNHLTSKYIADPATKSLDSSFWRRATAHLGKDISAENRAVWVSRIKASVPADMGTMKATDVQNYCHIYQTLGESPAALSLMVSFVDSSKEISQKEVQTIIVMLGGDKNITNKDDIAKLIEVAQKRIFADAGTVKSMGLPDVAAVSSVLSSKLTDTTRSAWLARVKEGFTSQAEIGNLTEKNFGLLSSVLRNLQDQDSAALRARLINDTNGWQSWSSESVATLAGFVGRPTGDAYTSARAKLVALIDSKYLVDAAGVRKMSVRFWRDTAGSLKETLDVQTRKTWAQSVKVAYAGDAEQLAKLTGSEVIDLVRFLTTLDAPDTSGVISAWLKNPEALKKATFQDMKALLVGCAVDRKASRPSILQIAEHITSTCLSDAGASRGATLGDWGNVAINTNFAMTAEMRNAWIDALHKAGKAGLPKLLEKPLDFKGLIEALNVLGDPQSGNLVADLIISGDAWQKWGKPDIVWLFRSVSQDQQADSQAARVKLVALISSQFKEDPKFAITLGISNWAVIALAGCDLNADSKKAMADMMMQTFAATDKDLLSLSAVDFKSLMEVMASLDKSRVPSLLGKYFADSVKRSSSIVYAGLMMEKLARTDKQIVADVLPLLDEAWRARDVKQPLTFAECKAAFRAWFYVDQAKAKDWAMKVYQTGVGTDTARSAANLDTLTSISWVMDWTGLMSEDKDWSQYLSTLVSMARAGKVEGSPSTYNTLSRLLVKESNRKTIEDNIVDSKGVPCVALAKIVNCAYWHAEDLKTCRSKIEGYLAKATDADTKALWLVAMAHASALDSKAIGTEKMSVDNALPWLDKAMAESTSDEVRLTVLKDLVMYNCLLKRYEKANSIVASVQGQFKDSLLSQIKDMQQQLQDKDDLQKKTDVRSMLAAEQARKNSLMEYYNRQMKAAESAGETDKVAKLKVAIEQLKKDGAQ